jgi:hypothetical protein
MGNVASDARRLHFKPRYETNTLPENGDVGPILPDREVALRDIVDTTHRFGFEEQIALLEMLRVQPGDIAEPTA